MKAAIYARKSTDDKDKGKENQSVTRQVEQAKVFITEKGWSVDPDHIYIDDGISGTIFPRPALMQLIDNLSQFDVVVMMDGDRLGRDQEKTPFYRTKIRKKAKLFYYQKAEEATARTPIDKYMEQTWDLIAAMEVELSSQRSREALVRKAKKGYNVGGVVYGYDNIWVYSDGQEKVATPGKDKPKEAHTEYRISRTQAEVINRLFTMYADGFGLTTIAKTMNGDPKHKDKSKTYFNDEIPEPPRKGTGSWAPSSIRDMLRNPRYEGKIQFGKYKKVREDGEVKRIKQDEYEIIEAPELRIVPKELYKRVQKRREETASNYIRNNNGSLWGRPGSNKHLLTGHARCSCCGGSITQLGGSTGSGRNRKPLNLYGCSYHKKRGSTVCSNDHKERMEVMDSRVIGAIEQQLLTPDATVYTIEKAMDLVQEQQKQKPERPAQIDRRLKKLNKELTNFMQLIADGIAPDSVLQQITERESEIAQLETEKNELTLVVPDALDSRRLKKALTQRMGQFKDLIYSDVTVARQALRKLLAEPMQFTPVIEDGRKTFSFRGEAKVGALLDPNYMNVASPRGFEPLLPP